MLGALPEGKFYNFFIDDNIFFFTDIAREKPASLFDHFYLANLRRAYREYGVKFTLNTFYQNWHEPEFDLSQFPERYRAEFEDNADWLRLAFHGFSEFPERPYSEAYPEKFAEHYELWESAVTRIAGAATVTPPVIFHYFDAVPEARRYMRRRGMKFFTLRSGNGIVRNDEFDQYEIPLDIFLNRLRSDLTGMREILSAKIAAGQKMLLVGSHEQYAYPRYARFIPEYFDGVLMTCRLLTENGYSPVYFNDLIRTAAP